MTTEEIAGKLAFFHEQIHLIHWQTRSYAEHRILGNFYEYLQSFKDEAIEKLMGYTGKRIQAMKIELIGNKADSMEVVDRILKFAEELMNHAESNKFWDVVNMAQALSGEAAKTKYLLTLS
jgi:hypothetical protein